MCEKTIVQRACHLTQDMIMLADTEGDGKVSLDEFKVIMRAGPKIKPSSRPSGPPSAGVVQL